MCPYCVRLTPLDRGESEKQAFECELELFKEVDAEDKESVYAVRPRDVLFHIMKKERGEEYWPRLLKDKVMCVCQLVFFAQTQML